MLGCILCEHYISNGLPGRPKSFDSSLPDDVEPALREAFRRKDELVLMDFITDQTENVYPMVQGGKGLTEMILAEEL